MSSLYSYASGDLLNSRNTYAYSPFHGDAFLAAWRAERSRVLESLPAALAKKRAVSVEAVAITGFPLRTGALIEYLRTALDADNLDKNDLRFIDWLIQRFEVTKRVHESYGLDGLSEDKSKYHDKELYVAYAELMSEMYNATHRLDVFNVLLKVMDTLCSFAPALSVEQQCRLGRLILDERQFFEYLQRKVSKQ